MIITKKYANPITYEAKVGLQFEYAKVYALYYLLLYYFAHKHCKTTYAPPCIIS